MKKIIYTLALIVGLSSYGYSFTRTIDEPIEDVSDVANAAVTVATAPWTQLITSKLIDRDGILITNPSTNTGSLFIHISTVTTTPTVSTNTAVIEIKPTETTSVLNVSDRMTIFGITTHTAAETIYLQEFRQRE